MPDLTLKIPMSDTRLNQYLSIPEHKRQLLEDAIVQDVTKFVDNASKGRKTKPEKTQGIVVQLVKQHEYVANNLQRVADVLDTTVLHTTRIAICDFLGLPEGHIDRQPRTGETTSYEVFYQINLRLYDVQTMRMHFHGAAVKGSFKRYFEQWCRKHLGE